MNIDELYAYVGTRTGLERFHLGLAEGKIEFSKKEAEEIAECMEFICEQQKKHAADREKKT